jgi:sulfite exporter TauE/SafE
MCGPLVLTAGRAIAARSRARHLAQLALHHSARIFVYAVLALPAGLAGEMLVARGFNRVIAVSAGVVLLVAAMGSLRVRGLGRLGAALSNLVAMASKPVFGWSRTHPSLGPLLLGALNGMLPCGLVYGALTTAAVAGSVGGSVLLMAGFGVGTSAILIAISNGAAAITPSARLRLRPLTPLVLAVTAAILIARGVLPPHQHDAGPPAHHHMHE